MGDEIIKEPLDPGSVPGTPGQDPGSPPGDQSADGGVSLTPDLTKPPPFDSDPRWKSARTTEKAVNELLEKTGIDSLDHLDEFLTSSKEIREKLGDTEVDELLEHSQELQKIHAYWAEVEEKKQRASEEPEETIARLEKEKNLERQKLTAREEADKAVKEAQKAVEAYTSAVDMVLDGEAKEFTPALKQYLRKALGVDNPYNDVDITDKIAVRKLAKDGVKEFQGLVQTILKDYKAGKLKLIDISPAEHISPIIPEEGPKNLKQSRALFLESMKAIIGKK